MSRTFTSPQMTMNHNSLSLKAVDDFAFLCVLCSWLRVSPSTTVSAVRYHLPQQWESMSGCGFAHSQESGFSLGLVSLSCINAT